MNVGELIKALEPLDQTATVLVMTDTNDIHFNAYSFVVTNKPIEVDTIYHTKGTFAFLSTAPSNLSYNQLIAYLDGKRH
jgi:hypothetical protein